jgi:hypothetical protein
LGRPLVCSFPGFEHPPADTDTVRCQDAGTNQSSAD